MALFAIGDLHLSFGTNKPMNIFRGWDHYERQIETAWNQFIRPDDTVVIVGDISWAMNFEQLKADFAFLQNLPGKKLIIKGNHDYWWDTMKKMQAFCVTNSYTSIGFIHNSAAVCGETAICGTRGWFYDLKEASDKKVLLREVGRLETSIAAAEKTGKKPTVFLHYPPLYGDYRCDEIMNTLINYKISRCYYGHLHAQSHTRAIQGLVEGIEFFNVSADKVEFKPVLVE